MLCSWIGVMGWPSDFTVPWMQICNAVAVAKLLNATLILPHFHLNSVWRDPRYVSIADLFKKYDDYSCSINFWHGPYRSTPGLRGLY